MDIKHVMDFEYTPEERSGKVRKISIFLKDVILEREVDRITFVYGRTWNEPKGDLGVETLDKHSDF